MKKALYIVLLAVEIFSLFVPVFAILYFHGVLASVLLLLAMAAVYVLLGVRAAKQKKAENEEGLKKTRIITALICPVVWVAFIAYFYYICYALGVI